MASVKVAVRVRPFNKRELDMQSDEIIKMNGNKTSILNAKIAQGHDGDLGRERVKEFTFDYSYWSVDPRDSHFVTQDQVFEDLGKEVVENAFEGYNACVFAYGQTGSGKTFTMMGTPDSEGLIPRICKALFTRMKCNRSTGTTFRTEVSYLEIYNEKVKDLLKKESSQHNLKVREHPKLGPYVQDLSTHIVMDYSDVYELMSRGNTHRTTASTAMNDVSSRSHAIFTINFSQATFSRDMPSETVSKVNLVDLAGSERADATGASGQRLKEGGHINKSLVTLGSVISTLAESSSQLKKSVFVPYRNSVLTWLLKDSLGGNSKTIMIATISPAECNYAETLSTLRYANRAKNIINKPTINEDPNVKLIKELREEIALLKSKIMDSSNTQVIEKLHENEARVKVLTEEWTEKWKETHKILKEQKTLGLRRSGVGVVLDSEQPHLIGLGDDLLSTGVVLYHLKEGKTYVGTEEAVFKQDIVLTGEGIQKEHCVIELDGGKTILIPNAGAECSVNTIVIDKPTHLVHGCVVLLGRTNVFRYNDPSEVDKLRKERDRGSNFNLSHLSFLSRSASDLAKSVENLWSSGNDVDTKIVEEREKVEERRKQLEELEMQHRAADERRKKEQEAVESELQQKKEQLEGLRKETEVLKKMAEDAHVKAEEEQNKLKKITEELEKHLQEQANFEKDSSAKILEIQQELRYLMAKEKEVKENTDRLNQRLQQERVYVLSKLETEKSKLYDEIKSLEMQEADLKKRIEEHSAKVVEAETSLQAKKEQCNLQAELLKEQLELLQIEFNESLNQAKNNWQTLLSTLPGITVDIPLPETLNALQESMEKVRQIVTDKKQSLLVEVQDERQNVSDQIDALKAKKRLLESLENGDDENLKASMQFLDKELECLQDEESHLSEKEEEIEDDWRHNLDTLDSFLPQFQSMIGDLEEIKDSVSLKRKCLLERENSFEKENASFSKMQDESKRLDEQYQKVQLRKNSATDKQIFLRSTLNEVDNKIVMLKDQEDSILAVLMDKRERLQCELDKLDGSISEVDMSESSLFLQPSPPSSNIFLNIDDFGAKTSSPISAFSSSENLDKRIQEMRALEEQFLMIEKELEERRQAFETERAQELGKIELERLNLQELEQQERIMALLSNRVHRSFLNHSRNISDRESFHSPTRTSTLSLPILPTSPYFYSEQGDTECPVKITIPSYALRGTGASSHYEYEVKVVAMEDTWTIYRRYKRFRELHQYMKLKYGDKTNLPYFPPRKLFGSRSERVVEQRRRLLEVYLIELVNICRQIPSCPLHDGTPGALCKQNMWEFAPFFRKGCFETSKHGTG